jgi:glycosyltransferase involved in cell wall biosynthesis
MNVLFIHENTLGHGSYLPVFLDYFHRHPELGIEGELLNATPLPDHLARKADATMRGLRRFGLDMHFARWRNVVSAHVRDLVAARDLSAFGAIVVNTQSIALNLIDLPRPLLVCLDATFRQLSESKWFSDLPLGALATTLNANVIKAERALFERAKMILPWSHLAARSVEHDYNVPREKISILPPSIEIPERAERVQNRMPKALFIGSDFKRKGGEILLQAFDLGLKGKIELEIVSENPAATRGNVRRGTVEWEMLWKNADLFVFPSKLETFGIVLIEALAFGVPIVSSRAGAAEEILENGKAGFLLDELDAKTLAIVIDSVLHDSAAARERAEYGHRRAQREYNLATNAARFADALKGARR